MAKDLIKRILVIDPKQRLTLEEVTTHPWLNSNKIPTSLPKAFLAVPPTQQFIKDYMPEGMAILNSQSSFGTGVRLEQTAPTAPTKSMQRTGTSPGLASTQPNNMLFTDRNGLMNRNSGD
jgi:serine/threonine protein kinase